MEGIYLIDKPEGISSYSCIRKLKKVLNFKKIGHSGTLDPFASGLLVILVGKATKLASLFLNDDKDYEGVIYFGRSTDSFDETGKTVEEIKDFTLNKELIDEAIKGFIGNINQKPPIFSALSFEGKRLYNYARSGEVVKVNTRKVTVNELKTIGNYEHNEIKFFTSVSKGTYIRSLANDLGVALNIPSHLAKLRRVRSGSFFLKDAIKFNDIKEGIKPTLTIKDYAATLERLTIMPYLEKHVLNGIQLDDRQTTTKNVFAVYNELNKLLAIYKPVKADKYNPLIILEEDDESIY